MVSLPSWIFSKASNVFASLIDEGEELARATLQEIADNNLIQYSVDAMHRVVVLGARDQSSIQWAQDAMEVLGLDRRIVAYCYAGSYITSHFNGIEAFDEISARNGALVATRKGEFSQIPVCCSSDVWKSLTEEQQRQVKCVVAHYPDDLPNKHLIKNLVCYHCPSSPEFDLERLTCHEMEGGECKTKALTSNSIKGCLRFCCACCLGHEEIRTDEVGFICGLLDDLLCKPKCGPVRAKILIAHTLWFYVEACEDDEDSAPPSPEQFIEFFEKFKAQFEVLEYQCVKFGPDLFTRDWTDESLEQWSKLGKVDRYTVILPWSNRRPVIFNGVEMPFSENDLI